jgi:hypothetical protein
MIRPNRGQENPMPARASLSAVFAVLIALLIVAGCGRVKEEKRTNALEAATSGYGSAIRWGYYETAFGYLHPESRGELPDGLDNIRVTSYDVVQPPVLADENTARQIAHLEYLHNDVQVVRSLSDRQEWRYDEASTTWWLHSGLPAFR